MSEWRIGALGTTTAIIFGVIGLPQVMGMDEFGAGPSKKVSVECLSSDDLSKEQLANAETIMNTAARLDVPEQGSVVALATAMQESTLRNLDYGDRDSVGLFQQRDAWGSTAERMDPAASTEMFFTGGAQGQAGLLDIEGWQSMSVAEAAQAVQVSAYPDAYAKHEPLARDLVGQADGCDKA